MQERIIYARPGDEADILRFIRALAVFEKLEQEVIATEEKLRQTLFGEKRVAEVVFFEVGATRVGFALFFHNYSTFLAQPGIYLEDLFILPEWRGRGYGERMLTFLARLAVERGCGRLEWSVLDWNVHALRFYHSLGARPLSEWTAQRVTGPGLIQLASQARDAVPRT